MASMVENSSLAGADEGHMHSGLEIPHSNDNGSASRPEKTGESVAGGSGGGSSGGGAGDGGGGNGDGDDDNGDTTSKALGPLYDEAEDTSGARQTLIQNRYCFWYYRKGTQLKDRDPSEAYESGIKLIESFQTVEHFWRIYNHILRADQVPTATDVHLFRDGIKPTWEDPSNTRGGQLLVRMKKGLANRAWESLVLAIVGEQFDVGNDICGAVVSVRYSEDVISVWNRSASNSEGIEKIKETVKRILKIPPSVNLEYRRHQDNLGAANVRAEGGGGYPPANPGYTSRGAPPGTGGVWTRNRGGTRGLGGGGGGGGGGGDDHNKDGDRAPAAGASMPVETWARGPPEGRDRERDGGGFRGGGGMGAFRPSSGRWSDRRTEDGGGGMKDFTRDRGDREKDLEKWGKVRKDSPALRDRDRDTGFRDREFREREPERDWGRLRRPGASSAGIGGGLRGGGGDGEPRRTLGLAALERANNTNAGDDGKGRDWGKLRHAGQGPASPDRERRQPER